MRINHNISAMVGAGTLTRQGKEISKSLEKLSTGLRINRAADDAAGLSVSESLRSRIRGMQQAGRNVSDGISVLQIMDSGRADKVENRQRMRELALQAATDTLTTVERTYLDAEFQHLIKEYFRNGESAAFGNLSLNGDTNSFGSFFSGHSILHIGAGYDPTADQMSIRLNNTFNVTYAIYSDGTTTVRTADQALSAIVRIDKYIETLNADRAQLGAYTRRLEHALASLQNQEYNMQDAESRIRDADFAQEATGLTRAQILSQSATAMLAQANQQPQGVLALLAR